MIKIRSYHIATWPRALLCHRDFHHANLCKVRTWNGYEIEILFDEDGYPLTDQSLITRIANFYNRRFIPIQIDNEIAYANVVRIHVQQIWTGSRGLESTPANS